MNSHEPFIAGGSNNVLAALAVLPQCPELTNTGVTGLYLTHHFVIICFEKTSYEFKYTYCHRKELLFNPLSPKGGG